MSASAWSFEAQRGYFSHDHDPESWDFRATTLPSLGLLERNYPTDDNLWAEEGQASEDVNHNQWSRFLRFILHLNEEGSGDKRYKLFIIIRHGQGLHNVKEAEVGREEWNRHWAKLPGDGVTTWLDAELTPKGEQQATEISAIWGMGNIPPPQSVYSSPLRRCLRTTALAFAPCINSEPATVPVVKDKLRERLGVHSCDQRSSRTWIAINYPNFEIEADFVEEDELWKADHRETLEEHAARTKELLNDIFTHDESQSVGLVAHSGAIMALFDATGWKKVPVAAGAVYPLFVARTRLT
ncbi:histidine phosphatase superfamily [Massariosphaeria phaeospora]|uniref:Histidine phosphatase superfamily n=1 Tax=Massariosphaeria phaeospora TaxID=100035 RepID=A0A7C8I0A5_9PLEO|nr:histidine phosphatase superfamily [Massariosphaeria phaeospora]